MTGEPLAPKPVSAATRNVMQANKSKNTKPELKVRAALREAGFSGYRLHWKKAPGKPDICFPGRRVAIFVNGCFWHRCPHCGLSMPKSNVEFWEAKFARNRARDARDNALLVSGGWTVITIWECRLKKGRFDATMRELVREIRRAEELRAQGLRSGRLVEIGSAPAWRVRRERHRRRGRRG
ncbi:very short patch repair endonuclease [Paratractidigestivibacter faecalis]|uniref:very short patch repair endonuclease n=1 Tax=Paratractidigestivibacter faecalis TaxID=2292441 RepID=UPI003F9E50D0